MRCAIKTKVQSKHRGGRRGPLLCNHRLLVVLPKRPPRVTPPTVSQRWKVTVIVPRLEIEKCYVEDLTAEAPTLLGGTMLWSGMDSLDYRFDI